jgi:hypothetical protein
MLFRARLLTLRLIMKIKSFSQITNNSEASYDDEGVYRLKFVRYRHLESNHGNNYETTNISYSLEFNQFQLD